MVDRHESQMTFQYINMHKHSAWVYCEVGALSQKAKKQPLLNLDIISVQGYIEYLTNC